MSSILAWLGAISFAVWLGILMARSGFWLARERLGLNIPVPRHWPGVVAIVPARNEAAHIGQSFRSLLAQDHPGSLSIVHVDDASSDDTASVIRDVAASGTGDVAHQLVSGRPLEPGWTGKLWAMQQGLEAAQMLAPDARYVLFTDADVALGPATLRRLVAKAEAERLDLASLMVRLHCESLWERFLIPAFIFFFMLLYPFPAVANPRSRTAGAAGGVMLIRRETLDKAGGLAPIRGELIDDCALARLLKDRGARLWVGLADRSRSLRPFASLGDIWRMVSRSADTQLRHSYLLLAGTALGLVIGFVVPPVLALSAPWHGNMPAGFLGAAAWVAMAIAYYPTHAYYRAAWPAALLLPGAAAFYLAMTLDSAVRFRLGAGGEWKGRVYARRPRDTPDRP